MFVTHGDPDHHWYTDRVAEISDAVVICNKTMIREKNGKKLLLGSRDRGLAFTTITKNLKTISVDKIIQLDGMSITGIMATHRSLIFKLGPFSKKLQPGPRERVGYGAIRFKIHIDEKNVVNLADTLLHKTVWKNIETPDVLMIPIRGKIPHNTMDEREALGAVKIMRPKTVIPCHYNCPAFFSKNYNLADDKLFKIEIEKMGISCVILDKGESINI